MSFFLFEEVLLLLSELSNFLKSLSSCKMLEDFHSSFYGLSV